MRLRPEEISSAHAEPDLMAAAAGHADADKVRRRNAAHLPRHRGIG